MGKQAGLILILILGLFLRLINLNQSFWLDEASQALMSSTSVHNIWFNRSGDFHPPLFYFLAHIWLQVNQSEIWLRTLPVIFGVLNIYLLFVFAGKIFPLETLKILNLKFKISYVAAFLLAIAPYHIYYSQEFRSYSLLCLLGTLSMYFLYRKQFYFLAISNLLLLYTHYSGFYLILTQLLFVLFYDRNNLKPLIICFLLSAIGYLPWLPQLINQLNSGVNIDRYLPGWRTVLSIEPLKAVPVIFFKLIAGHINFISKYLYGLYILFVFSDLTFVFAIARKKTDFLYIWLLVPLFTMFIISFFLPQNQPFRIIYILPALILVIIQACQKFPKLTLTLFIYIAIVGNLTYFTRPRLQREQWRQALAFTRDQHLISIIKFTQPLAPVAWYAPDLPVLYTGNLHNFTYNQVLGLINSYRLPQSILVFEYLSDLTDPDRNVEKSLRTLGYNETRTYDYSGVGFIRLYQYD